MERTCVTRLFIRLLCACLFLALCACAARTGEPAEPAQARPSVSIGVSVLDLTNPYYSESVRGILDEAAKYNINVSVRDPQSDAHRRYAHVRDFIDEGVDAIIIATLSPDLMEPLLEEARRKHIKVVAQATKIINSDVHIASDEWEMGYKLGLEAGAWIESRLSGSARLAILDYPRIPEIVNRVKGMLDGLSEYDIDIELIAQRSASRPEEGFSAVMEILKEHSDVQVILCINDGGALGALQAVEQAGLDTDSLFIGGIDATPEAVAKVKANTAFRCSVDIYPYFTGTLDVNFVLRLLRGEAIPERYTTGANVVRPD